MEAIKRVFKFSMGGIVGAAVGAGVAMLMTPRRGEELQAETQALINQAQADGEAAKRARKEEMMNRFRSQVNDTSAFTEQARHQPPKQV